MKMETVQSFLTAELMDSDMIENVNCVVPMILRKNFIIFLAVSCFYF